MTQNPNKKPTSPSSEMATKYSVTFVNSYEEFDKPLEINFEAHNPYDVKHVISALAAFYSGDPCKCFINGQEAVLEEDWGLL